MARTTTTPAWGLTTTELSSESTMASRLSRSSPQTSEFEPVCTWLLSSTVLDVSMPEVAGPSGEARIAPPLCSESWPEETRISETPERSTCR